MISKPTNLDKARAAWGEAMPAWVKTLAEACDDLGQKAVGAKIGYSHAAVSQIIANKYRAGLEKPRRAVMGAMSGAVVQCPVLGEIDDASCIENQRRPFASTNLMRVKLFKACRAGCPNAAPNAAQKKEVA